jgi:hypothetical protein
MNVGIDNYQYALLEVTDIIRPKELYDQYVNSNPPVPQPTPRKTPPLQTELDIIKERNHNKKMKLYDLLQVYQQNGRMRQEVIDEINRLNKMEPINFLRLFSLIQQIVRNNNPSRKLTRDVNNIEPRLVVLLDPVVFTDAKPFLSSFLNMLYTSNLRDMQKFTREIPNNVLKRIFRDHIIPVFLQNHCIQLLKITK